MANRTMPVLLLITDDNQVLRQITKMTSEMAQVIASRRAAHAYVVLERAERVDVVIVGNVGDGVASLEILRMVRAKRPQARSILLGDAGDLRTSIEALHGGVVDHVLNPPLREPELLAIINLPAPRSTAKPTVSTSPVQPAKRPI
jgi:DNA-binding NtrC family response regulator